MTTKKSSIFFFSDFYLPAKARKIRIFIIFRQINRVGGSTSKDNDITALNFKFHIFNISHENESSKGSNYYFYLLKIKKLKLRAQNFEVVNEDVE